MKRSRRMWYNCLSEYLLKEGYVNYSICPCIFIKKSKFGFASISVYVDDLNLVETLKQLTKTTNYLKRRILEKQNFVSSCRSNISLLKFLIINYHILRKY